MKRLWICILLMVALASGEALAAAEYNSFMHDDCNAGRFDHFAWIDGYVYWLHAPDDSLDWAEVPANLYRMRPGEGEAEIILRGGEDRWIYGVLAIGDRLLLSVANENLGKTHPALVNADGSGYKKLPGNIGSVVLYAGTIYNSVDGGIYEIDPDTMKPERIYSYPAEIAGDNPTLVQKEGLRLIFVTDSFDWYQLDLQFGELRRIAQMRGDGFMLEYKFYIGDYDRGGTYRYDLRGGREKISDQTYMFLQGDGNYVRALRQDGVFEFGLGAAPAGMIFNMNWLWDDLESALVGACNAYGDFLLGGQLYHYDAVENRVELSAEPVAERLK